MRPHDNQSKGFRNAQMSGTRLSPRNLRPNFSRWNVGAIVPEEFGKCGSGPVWSGGWEIQEPRNGVRINFDVIFGGSLKIDAASVSRSLLRANPLVFTRKLPMLHIS